MVGLIVTSSDSVPETPFSILHQKVELEIDLLSRSLRGKTEININPHLKGLKSISLNCRQCDIKRVFVNGKACSNYTYDDPYTEANLSWKAGVRQWKMLKSKIQDTLKDPPEEELVITFPKSVKIDDLDPFTVEAQKVLLPKKDAADASSLDITQGTRAVVEQGSQFTSVTVTVEYTIDKIRDGMQFVGWDQADLRYPHAYTTQSAATGAACCLFPCIDKLTSRCTWDISITCSRTIGDAIWQSQMSSKMSSLNGVNGQHATEESTLSRDSFSEEDKLLDLVVVGTGELTDEIVNATDSSKKITSFHCAVPIAAHHVGFAIGPFERVDLGELREGEEDDRFGQNAIGTYGFCLPGRTDDLKNTCLPIAMALDFFIINYGSYPFGTYKLCFVDDNAAHVNDTASLSICSSRLLFSEDIIEPLDSVTRQLVHSLAVQWMGINIIPESPEDTWVVVGIAYFITDLFLKKLSGNNDYRYRQKKAADQVFKLDVARPPLYELGSILALDPFELEFMELKAPLVLFILDRRLHKAGGSTGLSRIIMRLFLNAKVGDMVNAAINTNYFIKQCEKLGHTKMDVFMTQWVYGAGCPRFQVSQRFNKKKLVVEMLVRQIQEEAGARDLDKDTFMREVKEDDRGVYAGAVQPVFTGPMTIRIHEADGTPYEHIIEIKEAQTKFDIPYNTKYKRLKRSRRQKERTSAAAGIEYAADGNDDVLLYCLGDVLQSEEEIQDWKLSDWTKEEEDRMSQESYEWIRMDADFEWICKMDIQMPGYMYLSQLQQDRDVVAQLESIQYMADRNALPLLSTIFVRTLMDRRYFHGIRTAAALALHKQAKQEFDWIGLHHLEKAFEELFCFPDSKMPKPNDFSDRAAYYIQCAIPQAVAKVRDNGRTSPIRARKFLFEKLRYNDNSNNEFSDSHYLAILMGSLAEAMSTKPAPVDSDDYMQDDDGDDLHFHTACLEEIDRYRRIDEWIPSHDNILSRTSLDCKLQLAQAGAVSLDLLDFLMYTREGIADNLRLKAFESLVKIGLLKRNAILRWFFVVLGTDPSAYMRQRMLGLLGKLLGSAAIGDSSDAAAATVTDHDGLTIEQETSTEARKLELERKQTIPGAIEALKAELDGNEEFEVGLWGATSSPIISLSEMVQLLDICATLYPAISSMLVVLNYPRYWACSKVGKGKVRFSKASRVRTKRITTLQPRNATTTTLITPKFANAGEARETSNSNVPATMPPPVAVKRSFTLKPPKKETPSLPSGASSLSSGSSSSQLLSAQPPTEPEKRPKLILKFGKGGSSRSP
ncbi:MAG: hypothetical protein Q9191_003749 [Dirinaria sp. TL-2023a]